MKRYLLLLILFIIFECDTRVLKPETPEPKYEPDEVVIQE